MNKFLLLIPLAIVSALVTFAAFSGTSISKNVELNSSNLVSLNSEINAESVVSTITSLESSTSPVTFLFIDSPGGSVMDGLALVNYLQHTKKPVHCIASYAASMAHAILESSPVRLGTPENILMQHKISGGAQGTPTEIEGTLKIMKGFESVLTNLETKRIGISKEEFEKRTFYPWYTFGEESVKENVIDAIVNVSCSSELYSKHTDKEVQVFIFSFKVRYSGCPLVPPVRIHDESAAMTTVHIH